MLCRPRYHAETRLSYVGWGPNAVLVNGYPAYPNIESGKTYVFPLRRTVKGWELIRAQGWGLVVPACGDEPEDKAPETKHEFIVREVMNVLLHGEYEDLYRFSGYMQLRGPHELNEEIIIRLRRSLPAASARWSEISTALLATLGIPRRKLDELVATSETDRTHTSATELLVAQTLREVPESERRDSIVRNMLKYSAIHAWGSAATLVTEFRDDPLPLKLLPGYLNRQQKGAFYIACWLVNNGQLELASRRVRQGGSENAAREGS